MSFQNFNPAIDKLKEEEAANGHVAEASTSSAFQSGRRNEREKRAVEPTDVDMSDSDLDIEVKRKQPKESPHSSHPKKLHKNNQGKKQASPSDNRSSHKQPKRDKLDFNVLVPQKSHSKRKGH